MSAKVDSRLKQPGLARAITLSLNLFSRKTVGHKNKVLKALGETVNPRE